MLILTRNEGQTIVIGDNIGITVLSVRRKQVKIGIDAPENVVINRHEIHSRIIRGIPRPKIENQEKILNKPIGIPIAIKKGHQISSQILNKPTYGLNFHT